MWFESELNCKCLQSASIYFTNKIPRKMVIGNQLLVHFGRALRHDSGIWNKLGISFRPSRVDTKIHHQPTFCEKGCQQCRTTAASFLDQNKIVSNFQQLLMNFFIWAVPSVSTRFPEYEDVVNTWTCIGMGFSTNSNSMTPIWTRSAGRTIKPLSSSSSLLNSLLNVH